jgi:hypothetical protein
MWAKLARWWVVLLGGVLLGAGLCLHGQLAIARQLRAEARSTFFLWRGVGQLTFIFQDDVTKAALWMNEVPDDVIRESDAAAWSLVFLGALVAVAATGIQGKATRRR